MKNNLNKLILLAFALCMAATAKAQWSLTGNAGTVQGTNFVGTTDAKGLYFKTNNATRMVISSGGKVGIGTTTPANKLTVNGSADFTGNVGIGTTSPAYKFDVRSATNVSNGLHDIAMVADASLSAGIATGWLADGTNLTGGIVRAINGKPLFFGTSNSYQTMTVTDNGIVGIGTSAPAYKFDVRSATNVTNGLHDIAMVADASLSVGIATGWLADGNNLTGGIVRAIGGKPLFFGTSNSYQTMMIHDNGNVSIGTVNAPYKLSVCGTIQATEVRVATGWCDYVFANDYMLPALSDVEAYINANKHLPDVTAGNVIETEGLEVGKTSAQMIKKIEELTLYAISQQKQIDELKAKVNSLVEKGGK